MNKIILYSDDEIVATSIPNAFIDHYMVKASGSCVKIYILLLRCIQSGENGVSISFLADKMDANERDIERALNYWENEGLLAISRSKTGEIIGIKVMDHSKISSDNTASRNSLAHNSFPGNSYGTNDNLHSSNEYVSRNQSFTRPHASNESLPNSSTSASFANGNISNETYPRETFSVPVANITISSDNSVHTNASLDTSASGTDSTPNAEDVYSWVCSMVEMYLKRPLSYQDQENITFLIYELQFDQDRIIQLYDFITSENKPTKASFVRKVAMTWDKEGIRTSAEAKVSSKAYNKFHMDISKALGLGRSLAQIEQEFVTKWHETYDFGLDIILEACNRSILNNGKGDFKYIDKILSSWHDKGIKTMEEIAKDDEEFHKNVQKSKSTSTSTSSNNNYTNSYKNTYNKPVNRFNAFSQREMSDDEIKELEKSFFENSLKNVSSE